MRITISVKIAIITTIVLLLTLAGSSVGTGVLFNREYTAALESRAVAIGQSLSSQLKHLLNLDIPLADLSGFESQCRALVDQYDGISYAMVVQPDGNILFHSDPARHGQGLANPVDLPDTAEDSKARMRRIGPFLEVVIPIYFGEVDYQGTVHIGFPADTIKKKLKRLLLSSGIVGLGIAWCSLLLLFLLLQSLVTKPLTNFIGVIQAIRNKEIDIDSSRMNHRQDEIGKLHAVFDELMRELNASRSEIENHANHLEDVVRQRTEDLREANRELREEVKERKEAENRYRELFENAPVMYVITRDQPDGQVITNCNNLFISKIGYDRNEIIGRKLGDFFAPETRYPRLGCEYNGAMEETCKSTECRLVTKDEQRIDALVQSIPQIDGNGEKTGHRGMFLDITARKRAEAEKDDLKAKLQRAEKMESIGVLAGGVAHDLNNILSGVVTYPELLLLQLSDDSPLRKPIMTIKKAGHKAAEIVQDLLTLARRGVTTRQALNINDIISEYLASPEYAALKSFHQNVTVGVNLGPKLLNMLGSPIHIRKTIMNLVSNAAEAQPAGGRIVISTYNHSFDRPQMGYERIREGDFVALEISDQGCGICTEDLNRIFEPFYTKKVMGRSGTGLGMAVVWGAVQDHQGHIDIVSNPDEGTTFYLYFPVTRKHLEKEHDAIHLDEYRGDGQVVLIVDDVEEQREIAANILEMFHYTTASVSSGKEAIAYLQTHEADLILLDMVMDPGMDGLETYKRILEFRPHQKAVVASGFAETDRVRQAQKLGAGRYVKKPYTLEALAVAIKSELTGRK